MKTIKLLDQLKASAIIASENLKKHESLSDFELNQALANVSGATAGRILGNVSSATAGRILANARGATAGRILDNVSSATAGRILANVSGATAGRILDNVSGATAGRILGNVSSATAGRILDNVSGATAGRILDNVSGATAEKLNLVIPVLENLDADILKAVGDGGGNLNMDIWHNSCGTTHCRAGWAITLGGDAGAKLESLVGSELAGKYIYEASTGRAAPDFFADNETAFADIKACAAL